MAERSRGQQSDGPDPKAIIAEAMRKRDAGTPRAAIPAIRAALETHPDHLRLWHVLGLMYRADEDSANAIEAFTRAVAIAPRDPKVTHALARVTMEAGRPATDLFDKARQYSPADGSVIMGRAAAQSAVGDIEAAIADLDDLLGSNPLWIEGQELLANLRWMNGERDHFTAGFERALATHPSNQGLWFKLINALCQVGRFNAADTVVERARKYVTDVRVLDISEAICASEVGDPDRADRLFDRVVPYTEMPLAVRYMRHMLRTGRPEQAAKCGEERMQDADANEMWPYLGLAWRMTDDPRWDWLERDERLIKTYDIGERVDMTAFAEHLRTLHVLKADMAGQSVRGGTQTDGPLFARADPEIRELRAAIVDTVTAHMHTLAPIDSDHPVLRHSPGPFQFGGSWSVRLAGAGRHTNHIHPRGWYSSALYVSLPLQEDFGEPPAGWLAFGKPPEELGLDLEPFEIVEPKVGTLALFPSIMWHGTIPFDAGERLTVAFDVQAPISP
ncbi:putative 2OG-Fe(II) oxygenase [Parasphingopyxis sp.]|uniref:2OG-Fe(II) oxygenase family protein n=1 Tax=Parasphingopyxis sp. TaxID=1920299 RepID=UPI00261B6BEA|nr:putative 2OG-Fe(II) oxygenase [Parasphingopyxis sp.]